MRMRLIQQTVFVTLAGLAATALPGAQPTSNLPVTGIISDFDSGVAPGGKTTDVKQGDFYVSFSIIVSNF
jgi:hypothetical protein